MAAPPKLHAPEPETAEGAWTIRDLIRAAAAEQGLMQVDPDIDREAEPDANWTETLALVAGAVDVVRGNEAVIAALEIRNRELEVAHAEEAGGYDTRIESLSRLMARAESARAEAEERAGRAEMRAATAEEFLRRIGNQVRGFRSA
jgi:hypothetical protein